MTSSGASNVGDLGADGHLNIEGVLECPICLEYLSGQIFQCRDGHIMCGSCYNRLAERQQRHCPVCKIPFPLAPIRNRALESIAARTLELELVDPEALPEAHAPAPPALRASLRRDPGLVHRGVRCNGEACAGGGDIYGVRYVCAECTNFNICEFCASTGIHAQHMMIRVPCPAQTHPVATALERFREARNTQAPAAQPTPVTQPASNAPRRILQAVRRTNPASAPVSAPAHVQQVQPRTVEINIDAESDDTEYSDIEGNDVSDMGENDDSDIEGNDVSDMGENDDSDIEGNDVSDMGENDDSDIEANDGSDIEGNDGSDIEANDGSDIEGNDGSDIEANDGSDIEGIEVSDIEQNDDSDDALNSFEASDSDVWLWDD